MLKFPTKTLQKIELINSMLETINSSDTLPITYDGGTYPLIVMIKPIVIKNQFVTIENNGGTYIDKKERYNINKKSICGDDFCIKHLNHTLNTILKSFKNL